MEEDRKQMLSPQFQVACAIYGLAKTNGVAHVSDIMDSVECVMSRDKVPANLSYTHEDRVDIKKVDACIAPLIKALNEAGIRTDASCCGHGERDGFIVLHDGRELVIRPNERQNCITNPQILPKMCIRCGVKEDTIGGWCPECNYIEARERKARRDKSMIVQEEVR